MPSYFFPCLALAPGDLPPMVETAYAVLRRRQWENTTFDFATLGASHKLQFSWHLLDVFLNACHLEIEIRDAPDFAQAQERVRILQVMLYLQWVSPFIMPVGMTHTLRDYSGLNYRDSASLRAKLPIELQTGFVSPSRISPGASRRRTALIEGLMTSVSRGIRQAAPPAIGRTRAMAIRSRLGLASRSVPGAPSAAAASRGKRSSAGPSRLAALDACSSIADLRLAAERLVMELSPRALRTSGLLPTKPTRVSYGVNDMRDGVNLKRHFPCHFRLLSVRGQRKSWQESWHQRRPTQAY